MWIYDNDCAGGPQMLEWYLQPYRSFKGETYDFISGVCGTFDDSAGYLCICVNQAVFGILVWGS